MRLIGVIDDEKKSYFFCNFLSRVGIHNNSEKLNNSYRIWVTEEEDFEPALTFFEEYQKRPDDPKFYQENFVETHEPEPPKSSWKIKLAVRPPTLRSRFSLTNLLLLICILLFLWNNVEMKAMKELKGSLIENLWIPPVQTNLLFDYTRSSAAVNAFIESYPLKEFKSLDELPPQAAIQLHQAQNIPFWKGIYEWIFADTQQSSGYFNVPFCEKIRQGEVWRLFTPTLLHYDFLHLLFNMSWLWFLGRQLEGRLGALRLALFIIIVGVIANISQYVMTGPHFLGFSGVAVGMVSFIWMRQKRAPWEGYPLQPGTTLFVFYFVLAIFALQLVVFCVQLFTTRALTLNIANTAHIVGGLVGILLGRSSLFARKVI